MATNWIERRIERAAVTHATELDLSLPTLRYQSASKSADLLGQIPHTILNISSLRSLNLAGHPILSLPPDLGKLANLEHLNLRNSRLADLDALQDLRKLRSLTVSCSPSAPTTILAPLENLIHLIELRLHGADTRDTPLSFPDLPNLKELTLSARIAIPNAIHRLSSLASLAIIAHNNPNNDAQSNVITLLPQITELVLHGQGWMGALDHLGRATRLQKLQLLDLDLDHIPSGLLNLPDFNSLMIDATSLPRSSCTINDLHKLQHIASLQHIALSSVTSTYLHAIMGLPNLRTLAIRNCPLAYIPDNLRLSESMEYLALSGCDLRSIPDRLLDLDNLHHLDLSYNQLPHLPRNMSSLSKLHALYMRDTLLARVPPWIDQLRDLTHLYLDSNPLGASVSRVAALSKLKELGLSQTELKSIPVELFKLIDLEVISLYGNRIRDLPSALLSLSKLKFMDITDNPITNPPPEITSRGLSAIQGFLIAIASDEPARLYEAKLLLVGEGEVGKTCLAQKMVDISFDIDKQARPIDSTEGIQILPWSLRTPQADDFAINVWDFGGQEIYHATHQFFLTQRSLYLFVWDARKEDRLQGFEYWLNVVSLLSENSPVIVVLNKSDQRIRTIDERALKREFPNIVAFHQVSARTGNGIASLIESIRYHVATLPHVGDTWPRSWSRVRKYLESLGDYYVDLDHYFSICRNFDLDQDKAILLARYLHDLGVILHFQDDPILSSTVILKPEWGTTAVYKVLDTKSVQQNLGRFAFKDLATIWGSSIYPASKHRDLLQLMIKFELCFLLDGENAYIVPELLKASPPDHMPGEQRDALILEFRYEFMPAGIIGRFIARNHRLINDSFYWKNGVRLRWADAQALVEAVPLSRKIRISVTGQGRKESLAAIRHDLDVIHRTLNDVRVQEVFPCICDRCSLRDPHAFALDTVRRYSDEKIRYIRCDKSLAQVSVERLLMGILPAESDDEAIVMSRLSPGGTSDARPPRKMDHLDIMRNERASAFANGPWTTGMFYLLTLVIIVGVLAAVTYMIGGWVVVIIAGGILGLGTIGALQLKQDRRLSNKSFLELMAMTYQKLPVIREFSEPSPKRRRRRSSLSSRVDQESRSGEDLKRSRPTRQIPAPDTGRAVPGSLDDQSPA